MDKPDIKITDLQGEQYDLAELIGLDNYILLSKTYGGTTLYIAKYDRILNIKRDRQIMCDFNGYNHKYLAHKYNLSDRTIRDILAGDRKQQLDGQICLFDDAAEVNL